MKMHQAHNLFVYVLSILQTSLYFPFSDGHYHQTIVITLTVAHVVVVVVVALINVGFTEVVPIVAHHIIII